MGNFVAPYVPVVLQVSIMDIMQRAYRMAQALKNPGTGISPSEQAEGLSTLNAMVDGFKIENLLIPYFIRYVFNLTNGKKDYSVGPGQDFDMERPEKIHRAGFVLNAGTPSEAEIPIDVLLTYEQYAAFVAKNVQSSYPLALYYQPSFPVGTATFWPVTLGGPQPVALYNRAVLQEFQSADDQFYAPQGYREMLMYNLAVKVHELYPDKPMDANVREEAMATKRRVKAQQIRPILISPDAGAGSKRRDWVGGLPKAFVPGDFRQ